MPLDASYQETGWKLGEAGNLMSHHLFGPFALARESRLRAHPHIDGQTTVTIWQAQLSAREQGTYEDIRRTVTKRLSLSL